MKKFKVTKETFVLTLITILSIILNCVNLGIEGTGNSYYAAAIKSMTVNFKNFFFVSFDPAGFMSIDKPPLGFWLQAISAKIFGFSGWSIILPQAVAGVLSVIVIYFIVKRAFGSVAGLLSSLFLSVTPVFVAASRNNTIDNTLVFVLLLACWALSIAAEKGKLKYLILSLVLVGIGFNVKMLQAYMIGPALYITYLLSTAVSLKKRIVHLIIGTVILVAVSLSWALVVDSIPSANRPYVDSSTNNTVMELILGHNGAERLSLSSGNSGPGGGAPQGRGNFKMPPRNQNSSSDSSNNQNNQGMPNGGPNSNDQSMPGNPPTGNNQGMPGNPPSGAGKMGGFPGGNGGSSNLQGSFGGQVKSSITRLFSKNILSDQIVWFIPLAVLGFVAAIIKEKLKFRLNNRRKQSLVLWFMWFFPAFIFFSYNTGTFHSYYLTMLAAPTAALAAIGITSMYELYKEDGWKSWFLPISLIANGAVQLLMQNYFINSSNIIKVLMILLIILCFGSSAVLVVLKLIKKKSNILIKDLTTLALVGLIITPFTGSAAVLTTKLNGSFPAAGLELMSSTQNDGMPQIGSTSTKKGSNGTPANSKLTDFLLKNKTDKQKYLLVVSNSNSGSDIIINTGEAVMSLGGFLGNDKAITLEQFKALVKKGEIRYVMTGGQGGPGNQGGSNSINEIMNWVKENGTLVSSSEYSDANTDNTNINSNTISNTNGQNTVTSENNKNAQNTITPSSNDINIENNITDSQRQHGGFDVGMFGQLYDLKAYTE